MGTKALFTHKNSSDVRRTPKKWNEKLGIRYFLEIRIFPGLSFLIVCFRDYSLVNMYKLLKNVLRKFINLLSNTLSPIYFKALNWMSEQKEDSGRNVTFYGL